MKSTILTSSSPRRTRRLIAVASLATAAFLMGVVPGLASASSKQLKVTSAAAARKAAKQDPNRGTLGPAARRALQRGYLVPNQARYDRQKARITRRAASREALTAPVTGPLAPSLVSGKSWQGINDPNSAPPDETSAVGTTRYIELVNSRFAIYNKTSNTPIGTGTLNSLVGASSFDSVFDPQIIWDPTTNRFYYATDNIVSATDNRVMFGFSKTASPSSAADWSKYNVQYGIPFPDFPKLGDSRFFSIIGVNVFANNDTGGFLGSDLIAISKPPAGTTCPLASSFKFDDKTLSSNAFTPVPANEIDTNSTGWAVARANGLPSSQLRLFKVTRNATTGNPVIQTSPTNVSVPSYTFAPNAPQKGSVNKIDTSDSRNTQAVAAVDPGHSGKFAIWTQHTVNVSGRAAVRWYEIDPAAHVRLQTGTAASASLFQFNGAISPNRRVQGTTVGGGNAMVTNYNTSSSTTFPGVRMVSKIGGNPQSAPVAVKNSPGPLSGFDCSSVPDIGACRWGDYAAATPDPSTANRIWNVSQFAVGSGSGTGGPATSRTWNFVAKPLQAKSRPVPRSPVPLTRGGASTRSGRFALRSSGRWASLRCGSPAPPCPHGILLLCQRLAAGRAVVKVLPTLHREVLGPAVRTVHERHACHLRRVPRLASRGSVLRSGWQLSATVFEATVVACTMSQIARSRNRGYSGSDNGALLPLVAGYRWAGDAPLPRHRPRLGRDDPETGLPGRGGHSRRP